MITSAVQIELLHDAAADLVEVWCGDDGREFMASRARMRAYQPRVGQALLQAGLIAQDGITVTITRKGKRHLRLRK
jgi:hypothetical protein